MGVGRARLAVAAAGLVSSALVAVGCGGGSGNPDAAPTANLTTLTVYSSLPLDGPEGPAFESLLKAEKLALIQAGGRVGPFTVKFVAMDDSTPKHGRWDPGTVLDNTRKAVQDKTAIAYIGEGDSGASAIAIPALNEAGLLTVSPTSTYAGLTRSEDADKGEPAKYYPSGKRTFARIVPPDSLQAKAQRALMREASCRTAYVVSDHDVYGHGIAFAVAREIGAGGVRVVGSASVPDDQTNFAKVAASVAKARPDCIFTGVSLDDDAPALVDALGKAAPAAHILAPDALADPRFAKAVDPAVAPRVSITGLDLPDARLGAAAARFAAAYRRTFGSAPAPEAIYGYTAMQTVLAAIRAAHNQGNDRAVVLAAYLGARERSSALGRQAVDASGDVADGRYAINGIRGGRLRFERMVALTD